MTPKRRLSSPIADPLLGLVEQVVGALRENPGAFPDAKSLAAMAQVDLPLLEQLCILHYHASVEALIRRARLEISKTMLFSGQESISLVATKAGFTTSKAFRGAFEAFTGMQPEAYRAIKTSTSFELKLPPNYPLSSLRRALSRDSRSITERLTGGLYLTAHPFADGPRILKMSLSERTVGVTLSAPTLHMERVHAMVVGILGLEQNTSDWVALARANGVERLVSKCPELRIHQTPSIYDGLLWTIIGQQINMPFAFLLKSRLMMLCGVEMGEGLFASPTPAAVAALAPAELLPLQYSRQKADYVVSISRMIAAGELDLEALRHLSATRAEQTLLAVRGLGKWSVNYLMMRSLGFGDCLPIGDTGVTSSLWSLFKTERRPGPQETEQLMRPFSPFRSLATAHLWQWGVDEPI